MDSLVFMEILLIGLSLGHIKIWNHNLMEGSVYVLTNPAMPNMVKIGKTTRDVELRLADLYSTGVPLPFECEYAAKVEDFYLIQDLFKKWCVVNIFYYLLYYFLLH